MREAPSFITGAWEVARLHALRLRRSNRIWMAALAVALVDITAIATLFIASETDAVEVFESAVRFGYFLLLVFLVPFLLVTGMIAEEVEGRTFAFLLARPVARPGIALGKFGAVTAAAALFLAGGVLLLHVGVYITHPELLIDELPGTARIMGAVALLSTVYGAVCAFWGAVFPAGANVASAVFLGFMEFFFSGLPATFRYVSMNHWASDLAGLERGGIMPESVPPPNLWIAPLPIAGELILFIGLMLWVVSVSEFRYGRS